ncbi:hypothetical protein Zm00014a_023825 [Zea mays]|uniref:Uncharacterized protein n=1 Tax=Zea mays TaxID=4577 RepID=A0A3L6ECM5_MAIZE|nr:hypothetical protein Zm00014a_023825 [Zea mays]
MPLHAVSLLMEAIYLKARALHDLGKDKGLMKGKTVVDVVGKFTWHKRRKGISCGDLCSDINPTTTIKGKHYIGSGTLVKRFHHMHVHVYDKS